MKTTIEFGGFYESIHSSHIDMMTENYFDDTYRGHKISKFGLKIISDSIESD